MSDSEMDKPIETLHSAIKEMVQQQRQTNERLDSVSTELRSGLQVLADKQDKTNERLDKTNERLDKTNERLDFACLEFRNGFNYLSKEQIKTNEKLDMTNSKLDSTITSLNDFRMHVSKKLDGIGTYLMSIDDQLHDHEKWLRRLDERMKT
jgi:chromosome segregation ATPase